MKRTTDKTPPRGAVKVVTLGDRRYAVVRFNGKKFVLLRCRESLTTLRGLQLVFHSRKRADAAANRARRDPWLVCAARNQPEFIPS